MPAKRGISHIEMVLSFIIFVSAVGLALYFFSPANSSRLVESTLTYSFREIGNNISISLDSVSVKINNDTNPPNDIAVNISGLSKAKNVRVETSGGSILESSKNGDVVSVTSDLGWASISLINILLSDDFTNGSAPLSEINESFYQISSTTSEDMLSEKRALSLKEEYDLNYVMLKEEFNLPNRIDFDFSLVLQNETINTEREIPDSFEIFSEKRRVKVLRDDGLREFADLVVRVW